MPMLFWRQVAVYFVVRDCTFAVKCSHLVAEDLLSLDRLGGCEGPAALGEESDDDFVTLQKCLIRFVLGRTQRHGVKLGNFFQSLGHVVWMPQKR